MRSAIAKAAPPEWLTREELAQRIRASVRTVDSAIKEKKIKATRFGRLVRISAAEVARVEAEGFSA